MRRFFLILIVLFIPIVAIGAFLFLSIDSPVTIHDAGSTNFYGFDLTVNPNRSGQGTSEGTSDAYFDSDTFDFATLENSIRVPNNLYELFIKKPVCAHSASFGSVEVIEYDGLTSGDVPCLTDPKLKDTVSAAVKAAGYPVAKSPF